MGFAALASAAREAIAERSRAVIGKGAVIHPNGKLARTVFMRTELRVQMNARSAWGGVNSLGDVVLCCDIFDYEQMRHRERIDGFLILSKSWALSRDGRVNQGATGRREHVELLRSGVPGFVMLALTMRDAGADGAGAVSPTQYESDYLWRVERTYLRTGDWLIDAARLRISEYIARFG